MELDELFQGKELVKKNKEFKDALTQIENKYLEFFESRPPKFKYDEHERLHNHYMIYGTEQRISFAFDKDSDIPEYIKAECNQAFKKVYNL